jgi:transposase
LKRPWNVTPTQKGSLARLQRSNAPLYRAYLLKESFCGIFDRLLLPHNAARSMREWLGWAVRSKLEPFRKVAKTIKAHLDGILAFFDTGFTTGPAEGLNNKARLATRQAYGFQSAAAVLAAIILRCTGLEIPLPHYP